MGKFVSFILSLYILLNMGVINAAEINPDSLIKATPKNDPKCVEYYMYKSELYCSTTAQSSQTVDPQLKKVDQLNIVFDNRPWQLAWGKTGDAGYTIEYVPMGDDVENWNELITSQFFPDLQKKITLKQFADIMMQNLKEKGFDPIVTFHENTDDRVIFEFRIEQPVNQIQDELQMLIKDGNGIYSLHYVIKKADMGDENRDMWIQHLKDSTIKQ